jgi:hypothetical protein
MSDYIIKRFREGNLLAEVEVKLIPDDESCEKSGCFGRFPLIGELKRSIDTSVRRNLNPQLRN